VPAPSADERVKLVTAVLWADRDALARAQRRLEAEWGAIDHTGADVPFTSTDYYEPEMGPGLQKRILSFERLVATEHLPGLKRAAMRIEEGLRGSRGRRVNIDPGYLDLHKLVLASVKPAWQKLHIGGGVWADMALRYSRGRLHPFPWTFTDFASGAYDEDLLAIRAVYKGQLGSAKTSD